MTPAEILEQLRKKKGRQTATIEMIEPAMHRIEIGDPNGYQNEYLRKPRRRLNGSHTPETKLPTESRHA